MVKTVKGTLSGFTLIEILVVIAIVAVLAVIGFVVFRGLGQGANDSRVRGDVYALARAYEAHFDPASGKYFALQDDWFSAGSTPTMPDGTSYYNNLTSDNRGFRVCAPLAGGPACSAPAPSGTCYCVESSQGQYVAPSASPTSSPTASPTSSPTSPPAVITCSFTPTTTVTAGQNYTYTDTSTTTGTPINSWVWSTTAGTPNGVGVSIANTLNWTAPTTSGTYLADTIQLQVGDGAGGAAACNLPSTLTVNPAPNNPPTVTSCTVSPATATTNVSQPYTLSAVAGDPDAGDTITYHWTWGDGSPELVINPGSGNAHTYTTIGNKTVSLYVVDSHSASSSTVPCTPNVNVTAAAPTYVAQGSNTSGTTSLVLSLPSIPANGHFLLAQIVVNASTTAINGVPPGWVLVISPATSGSNFTSALYWKIANSEVSNTYTWGFAGAIQTSGGILEFSGATGIDASSGLETLTSTTINNTAINTTFDSDALIFFGSVANTSAITAPAGVAPGSLSQKYTQSSTANRAEAAVQTLGTHGNGVTPGTGSVGTSGNNIGQLVTIHP